MIEKREMKDYLLKLQDITKVFPGTKALSNVNFNDSGEKTAQVEKTN